MELKGLPGPVMIERQGACCVELLCVVPFASLLPSDRVPPVLFLWMGGTSSLIIVTPCMEKALAMWKT